MVLATLLAVEMPGGAYQVSAAAPRRCASMSLRSLAAVGFTFPCHEPVHPLNTNSWSDARVGESAQDGLSKCSST